GGNAFGETVKCSQTIYTVAGIMPPGFRYPAKGDVWMLSDTDARKQSRTAGNFRAIGRLRPGVTLEQSESELAVIAAGIAAANPDSHQGHSIGLQRLQEQNAAPYKDSLALLLGAAGLILLIACANI